MKILITGVSSGLGKSFSRLEEPDIDIIGVSRNSFSEKIVSYHEFEKMHSPDVIILNAAIGDFGVDFFNMSESDLTEIITVNLIKPISFVLSLYKNSLLNNLKSIIIIGSRFSSISYISSTLKEDIPGYGYCISKVALSVFTELIRKENFDFSVNIIHPGILNSQLGNISGFDTDETAKKLLNKIKSNIFLEQIDGIYDLQNETIINY
jgi:NAD(P)-dependent dehydrogenase (short-subunit alcohol dehydrogenase family)